MAFDSLYFTLAAIGFVLVGIVEIWQKRCFFVKKRVYTAASLRLMAPHEGITMILIGAAILVLRFEKLGSKICLFLIIGSMLYYAYQSNRLLVKQKK